MRNRNNLIWILLLAGVAYVVFYKKGNGSGNGSGNESGNGSGNGKPNDPDFQIDPDKFPAAGKQNPSGTMDIASAEAQVRFL